MASSRWCNRTYSWISNRTQSYVRTLYVHFNCKCGHTNMNVHKFVYVHAHTCTCKQCSDGSFNCLYTNDHVCIYMYSVQKRVYMQCLCLNSNNSFRLCPLFIVWCSKTAISTCKEDRNSWIPFLSMWVLRFSSWLHLRRRRREEERKKERRKKLTIFDFIFSTSIKLI